MVSAVSGSILVSIIMDIRHSLQRIGFMLHLTGTPHLAHFDDQIPEVVRRRDGQIEVETSGPIGWSLPSGN